MLLQLESHKGRQARQARQTEGTEGYGASEGQRGTKQDADAAAVPFGRQSRRFRKTGLAVVVSKGMRRAAMEPDTLASHATGEPGHGLAGNCASRRTRALSWSLPGCKE